MFATVVPIGILSSYAVIAWRSYVHQAANYKPDGTSDANAEKKFAKLTPTTPKLSANSKSNDLKSESHVFTKESSVDIDNGQLAGLGLPSMSATSEVCSTVV